MTLKNFFMDLAKTEKYPLLFRFLILSGSSWFFQGLIYMDRTERFFKLFLDLILTVCLFPIFLIFFIPPLSGFFSIIIAHTLNWIFNGQIFVMLKNLGFINIDKITFQDYSKKIFVRITHESSFSGAAVFGSMCRDELSSSSDLDIRILRKPGLFNGISGSFFVLTERTHAFFSGFPLDIFLLDNENRLLLLNEIDPIIIFDNDGRILKNQESYHGKRQ